MRLTNMNMQRIVRTALLAALVATLAAPAAAQNLELGTVEFFSPAVDRTMKYNIVLPRGYETSTERYPVLYLLHGLTQNYTAWGRSNGTPFYAGLYDDLIVVMPDGGNSWYVNWAANEGGQSNNWEDHIIRDVVNHVDWNFRTIARREGRAITGLSMGGYGAHHAGVAQSRDVHLDRQHQRRARARPSDRPAHARGKRRRARSGRGASARNPPPNNRPHGRRNGAGRIR